MQKLTKVQESGPKLRADVNIDFPAVKGFGLSPAKRCHLLKLKKMIGTASEMFVA